jgi:hypothetical protein
MISADTALWLRINSLWAVIGIAAFGGAALCVRRPARPASGAQLELRVEEAPEYRTLRLQPPITVGRGADAILRVRDPHASRLHAILDVEDGSPFVEDLGSRNGTLVNARPIEDRVRLQPGDEIRVGRVRIVFNGEVPWT